MVCLKSPADHERRVFAVGQRRVGAGDLKDVLFDNEVTPTKRKPSGDGSITKSSPR
jgi:hypothetical protein